jgi:hypothetical protein
MPQPQRIQFLLRPTAQLSRGYGKKIEKTGGSYEKGRVNIARRVELPLTDAGVCLAEDLIAEFCTTAIELHYLGDDLRMYPVDVTIVHVDNTSKHPIKDGLFQLQIQMSNWDNAQSQRTN